MSAAISLMKRRLTKPFEGFRGRPYWCPAGVASIGYGATFYADGRPVKISDAPISEPAADRLLDMTIRRIYMPATLRLCPTADTIGRTAALGDFAFNLGPTRLKTSTLRKRVLAGDWDGAMVEMRKWVRGGGKVLRGLVLRCEARCLLMAHDPTTQGTL